MDSPVAGFSQFALAIPIGLYMARVFDGRFRPPRWLRWVESLLNTGPQNWKQYALSFMAFNALTFVAGFIVLSLQPYLPLNPDGKTMLGPTTIFHTVASFLTNTNQQHYSGEVHLSYFSQLFFVCWKQAISPIIGMAALLAIIRGLRGDKHLGNFYVDMWRRMVYVYLPLCLIVGGAAYRQRRAHDVGATRGSDHAGNWSYGNRRQESALWSRQIARVPWRRSWQSNNSEPTAAAFLAANSAMVRESQCLQQFLYLHGNFSFAGSDTRHIWQDASPIQGCVSDFQRDASAFPGGPSLCNYHDTLKPNRALTALQK